MTRRSSRSTRLLLRRSRSSCFFPACNAPLNAFVSDEFRVETRLAEDGGRRFARIVSAHDFDAETVGIPDMRRAHAFHCGKAGQIRALLCGEFSINHSSLPLYCLNSLVQNRIGAFPLAPSLKPSNKAHPSPNEKKEFHLQNKTVPPFCTDSNAHRITPPPIKFTKT